MGFLAAAPPWLPFMGMATLVIMQWQAYDLPEVAKAIQSANYDYGLQFVRRGYVVVCPCLIPFGDRVEQAKYGSDPAVTFVRMMALGRVPIAENIRDIRWAVSFLQSRPSESENIGCAGLSYGGRMTMMATAVEPRIKVAAISGALNLLQERTTLRYSCGLDHSRTLKFGDYSEIASLIAPRPVVWEMGDQDKLIVKDGWDEKFKQRLEMIYSAYRQPKHLHYDHFKEGIAGMVRLHFHYLTKCSKRDKTTNGFASADSK